MAWDLKNLGDDKVASVETIAKSDIDDVITYCREAGDTHRNGGDMKHAARVPGWVMVDWCNKHGYTWQQFQRDNKLKERFLMDTANAPFRVWKGRL